MEAELAQAREELAGLAAAVSAGRREAAPRLAAAVEAELEGLAMEGAAFSVALEEREQVAATGAERVDFMLASNPGVPAAPVRESASGGELSRVMLALMTVAGAGGTSTLVFDEVDSGVGGQTARAVGERLRALGSAARCSASPICRRSRRLPTATSGSRSRPPARLARADVALLEEAGVVEELCRMLGADTSDAGARRHAEELLAAA